MGRIVKLYLRYIELFAGIGGFRYGLEKANGNQKTRKFRQKKNIPEQGSGDVSIKSNFRQYTFTCVWANEWDKYACQIYRKNFGEKELVEGDIRRIPTESIPDHDFLTGGFPCPTYSIAGKRKGFKDPRGIVFFEICRIAKVKKPALLLLENVKGLLNHDKGNTFKIILSSLSELGYDCEWEVLNSKNFGVPQNRERVFIVGHLRGKGGQKIFPIGEDGKIFKKAHDGILPSLTKTDYKGPSRQRPTIIVDGVRRLTPIECERLQGFPDGWTEKGIFDIIDLGILKGGQLCQNVGLKDVTIQSLLEVNNYVSNITKDGKNGGIQISLILQKGRMWENVNCVIDLLTVENCVCDTTNLGKDMEILYILNDTLKIDVITNKNLICELMAKKSTYPLLKIELEENLKKEKQFIISTWIKEIIKNQIFTYVKTKKPITNAIIVWKKLQQNYIDRELLNLKMGNIISISDTQRYKCLGNTVTTNVITEIGKRIARAPS